MYFQIFKNDDNLKDYICTNNVYTSKNDLKNNNFYFTTRDSLFDFLSDGNYVRKIKLPTDNPNLEIIRDTNLEPNTLRPRIIWRANMIILGKTRSLSDIRTIKYLFDAGINIYANNNAALRSASKHNYLDIVIFLLKNGADLHAKSDYALYAASKRGYLDLVDTLLKNGADVHAGNNYILCIAVIRGHLNVVKKLLYYGAKIDSCIIQHACGYGQIEIFKLLIECEPNIHYNKDRALDFACENGQLEMVKFLLDNGANIKNKYALFAASQRGHLEIVKYLLLDGLNQNINSALLMAALYGYIEIAKLLIDYGADVMYNNIENESALELASRNDHFKIVKLLLQNGIDNINIINKAFIAACKNNNTDGIKILLEYGADIHTCNDTAILLACCYRFVNVVELLLGNGADIYNNNNNVVAFKKAYQDCHTDVMELLLKNKVVTLLHIDEAYEYAIEKTNFEMILLLLKYGADPNIKFNELRDLVLNCDNSEIMSSIKEYLMQ